MIFTRSILNQLLSLENISSDEICRTLNQIGLEVESFRKIVAPKKVVVGKILECQKHPDATKLNVCQVAIGGSADSYETRQIVCGAPNARAGIYVAVALEGAQLPEIRIQKAVLRGVESCGMLCSTTELGFPAVNHGIVELDESIGGALEIGRELREYALFNDEVYEISITPNRGDCMSLIGVARDLSVVFGLEQRDFHGVRDCCEQSDSVNPQNAPGVGCVLQIVATEKHNASLKFRVIESTSCVLPLFVNLLLSYNESLTQKWLKDALSFSTLMSGVLLNAYPQNFCQLDNQKVILTLKKDAQGLESVYYGDKKLSTIGVSLCVSEEIEIQEREFVVLEASYIPPDIISQKVKEAKAQVDTRVFQRASRGSNPDLESGLSILVELLLGKDGVLYTDSQELIELPEKEPIVVDVTLMERVMGVALEKLQVINLLRALGFEVEIPADTNLIIATSPLYRHDITGFQDVVEEIIRFYGIDRISSTPLHFIQKNQHGEDAYQAYFFRRHLAQKSVSLGFSEVVHFVFEEKEMLQKYGFETLKDELEIANPITQELNTLRTTLLLGLLRAAKRNSNNGFNAMSLFEIGEVYDTKRTQTTHMALIQSGLAMEERYPHPKGLRGGFFDFCERISRILGEFSLESLEKPLALFHNGQCAKIIQHGKNIGILATLHPQVAEEFDLSTTYLCEVCVDQLEQKIPHVKMHSKFQKVQRDLSVVLNKDIAYLRVKKLIKSLAIPNITHFYPLDIFRDESLGDKVSLTLRFELQSDVKTLEEKDINEAMESVLESLKKEFAVELR